MSPKPILTRCKRCAACRTIVRTANPSEPRHWNTLLLHNPCTAWKPTQLSALFCIVLHAMWDVRPTKPELEAFARRHGMLKAYTDYIRNNS